MNVIKPVNLACPLDGKRLEAGEKQLLCEQGHSFDIARQGYVNLLPVQHKRSKSPGDTKEMVIARTQFLNTGVYQPVASRLAGIIFESMPMNEEVCILDAGCGEGYYLDVVFGFLKDKDITTSLAFIGLDISKEAIVAAARRNKQISWIVGTNRQPPVDNGSVDIIFCVFGFQSFEGFYKVLRPGGRLILVEPGVDHLKELREIIYPEVKKREPKSLSGIEDMGFRLVDSQQLMFKTGPLDKTQIGHLLLMTPHFFRATKEGREAAMRLESLDLTVDIVFRAIEKAS